MTELIWNSPPIPAALLDAERAWRIHEKAMEVAINDAPSTGDILKALERYSIESPAIRDAMDVVAVWFTGYTLASIAARALAAGDPDETLQDWRRRARSRPRPSTLELAAELADDFVERWGSETRTKVWTTDPASGDRRFTRIAQELFNDVYGFAERAIQPIAAGAAQPIRRVPHSDTCPGCVNCGRGMSDR